MTHLPAPRLDAGLQATAPPLLQYRQSASDAEQQVQYLAGQAYYVGRYYTEGSWL